MTADISLIIFDCDGVLIDSELLSCRVTAEELNKDGFMLDPDEVRVRFTGMSDASMWRIIEQESGRSLSSDIGERVHNRLMEAFTSELQAIDGINRLLDDLDDLGTKYCVASSSTPERLDVTLNHVGLYDRFPAIFSATMVKRGKPAPDLFIHAAQGMNTPPDACVVIEDSVPGVTGAHAAGMSVLGFCGGSHCLAGHGDGLVEAGAACCFDDMAALPALLSSLPGRQNIV